MLLVAPGTGMRVQKMGVERISKFACGGAFLVNYASAVATMLARSEGGELRGELGRASRPAGSLSRLMNR